VTAKPWARAEFTIRAARVAGIVVEKRAMQLYRYPRGDDPP